MRPSERIYGGLRGTADNADNAAAFSAPAVYAAFGNTAMMIEKYEEVKI